MTLTHMNVGKIPIAAMLKKLLLEIQEMKILKNVCIAVLQMTMSVHYLKKYILIDLNT